MPLRCPDAYSSTNIDDSLWILQWCEHEFIVEGQEEEVMPVDTKLVQ